MRRFSILSTLVALSLLTACGGGSKPDGSLTVTWIVGGQECGQAGLDKVDVELHQFGEIYDVTRASCSSGKVTFASVRPGLYDVMILGYPVTKTADGIQLSRADATYEGEASGLGVISGEEARISTPVVLTARKGSIYLNWKFQNGMMCSYNGVSTVVVTIYDKFSNAQEPMTFDCSLDAYIASLPPEDQAGAARGVLIEKLDAEPLSADVIGYDLDGNATHRGREAFQVDHGEVRDLIVTLQPCGGSCS